MWPLLLEKAYAKLCKGYCMFRECLCVFADEILLAALHLGVESTAFAELTGAPTQYMYA